jgi:hypothetical protein
LRGRAVATAAGRLAATRTAKIHRY